MSVFSPPRHIVWSTDHVDFSDPFQRRWYLRQVLMHGRAQDIRALNFTELKEELDVLNLPEDLHSLWKRTLEANDAVR